MAKKTEDYCILDEREKENRVIVICFKSANEDIYINTKPYEMELNDLDFNEEDKVRVWGKDYWDKHLIVTFYDGYAETADKKLRIEYATIDELINDDSVVWENFDFYEDGCVNFFQIQYKTQKSFTLADNTNKMNDNITYELCPHCEEEVELPNTLGVHKCPNCGKYIVACSMCLACEESSEYCKNCCLEHLAKKMNEETEEDANLADLKDTLSRLIPTKGVFRPLGDIEYWGGSTHDCKAVSIAYDGNDKVSVGYDDNGFLFTDEISVKDLVHTDFIDEVIDELESDYKYLYNKAYQNSNLGRGDDRRIIYCDLDDKVNFNDGFITSVEFTNDDESHLRINYLIAIDGTANGATASGLYLIDELDFETIDKLRAIVNREEKPYSFNGKAMVTINNFVGVGRTRAEALRNAKEEIECLLTLYGDNDTQINDVEKDIDLRTK